MRSHVYHLRGGYQCKREYQSTQVASRRNGQQSVWVALGRTALALLAAGAFTVAGLAEASAADESNGNEHWVGTWSNALHQPDLGVPGLANPGFNNQTLRQIVHVSVGGPRVRVRLSTFGASGLVIGAAHIALQFYGSVDSTRVRQDVDLRRHSVHHHPTRRIGSERPHRTHRARAKRLGSQHLRAWKYGTGDLAFRGPADLVHLSAGRFYSKRGDAGQLDDTGTVLAGGSGSNGVQADRRDRRPRRIYHGWFAVDRGRQRSMDRPTRPAAAGGNPVIGRWAC